MNSAPPLTAQAYALAIGPANDMVEEWYAAAKASGQPSLVLCPAILGLAMDLVDDPRMIDVLTQVFIVAADGRRKELLADMRAKP